MKKMKRREFLKYGALAAVPLTVPFLIRRHFWTDPANRSPATTKLRTRYEVNDPRAAPHLASYAKAIALMKDPVKNNLTAPGLAWVAQAKIHLGKCPHGTWRFFPWHREYLVRFEEVIRHVSGDPNFSLPYWDWSKNPGFPAVMKNPSFAPAYENPSLASSDTSRTVDFSARILSITAPAIVDKILGNADFPTFMGSPNSSGQPEVGPHNGVHGVMGGFGSPMGNFMSPLDPIFWLHHCNVDRLWASWQEKFPGWKSAAKIGTGLDEAAAGAGSGSVDKTTAYPGWLKEPLAGFYEADGNPCNSVRIAANVLDTTNLDFADSKGATVPVSYVYADVGSRVGTNDHVANRSIAGYGNTSLVVRAFTANPIAVTSKVSGRGLTSVSAEFPDLDGTVGKILDSYLSGDHAAKSAGGQTINYGNLVFRLKIHGFQEIDETIQDRGQEVRDPLLTNLVFLPNPTGEAGAIPFASVNVFSPTDEERASMVGHNHTGTLPDFNLDYSTALDGMRAAGIRAYSKGTRIRVEFLRAKNGSRKSVRDVDFSQLSFKLVILEKVNG